MRKEKSMKADKKEEKAGLRRREFLEALAASFAALSTSGCGLRPPEEKIIPYIDQPENVVPGLSKWYSTTCSGCSASCGALVKSRDGRPIKMEGNPDHPLSRGGLCARGQATVLDLYDSERYKTPLSSGKKSSWSEIDRLLAEALGRPSAKDRVRVVSSTITSPSLSKALRRFLRSHPGSKHVVYDPLSSSAILEAHRHTHGSRSLPRYHFQTAKTIVSFDADFLGTWISPVEFTAGWSLNRGISGEKPTMSWHAQFEPRMSLSGANADLRRPLPPSKQFATVAALGKIIAGRTGFKAALPPSGPAGIPENVLRRCAEELLSSRGRSLVVSGSPDVGVQVLVNWINSMLGNYGTTVDLQSPSFQRQGDDAAMDGLIDEMSEGGVDVLIVLGANPAYDHPRAGDFRKALSKVGMSVSSANRKDETASLCRLVAPDHHPLESWGDSEPGLGVLGIIQPLLLPLFDTRSALETLPTWTPGAQTASAYDFLKARWRSEEFPRQKAFKDFPSFWDHALKRGAVALERIGKPPAGFAAGSLLKARPNGTAPGSGMELSLYPSVSLGDGKQANNPWLQELPDPVSRVSWGNYASFSPADAKRLGLVEGRVVSLSSGSASVELPAHIQPGQADGVIAAALGYGRRDAGRIAANYPMEKMFSIEKDLLAGADLYPFLRAGSAEVSLTPRMSALAKVQQFDSLIEPFTGKRRDHVRRTSLEEFARDPHAASGPREKAHHGLWPKHDYKGHKWTMAVDLNLCTGCSACVVGCQAENNIPVVGKAEVRKSRDMYWMRLDRYYEDDKVLFQPMLCQQCDNAPCETVCPVLATVHSSEGLNMQVYNRCVGTRYCANNCPYKVRRFNWFDYAHQDLLQNLALNPDVTVRSRGVMEKCSFCVQRIYDAGAEAKTKGIQMKGTDPVPACVQSCPSKAIVFGDINEKGSPVAKAAADPRSYKVLEELGVGPSVFYKTKVSNGKA